MPAEDTVPGTIPDIHPRETVLFFGIFLFSRVDNGGSVCDCSACFVDTGADGIGSAKRHSAVITLFVAALAA